MVPKAALSDEEDDIPQNRGGLVFVGQGYRRSKTSRQAHNVFRYFYSSKDTVIMYKAIYLLAS